MPADGGQASNVPAGGQAAAPGLPGSEYYGDIRLLDGSIPAQAYNTSGLGQGYYLPPEARGWTFAGAIPLGIFAFAHRLLGLGFIIALCIIPHLAVFAASLYFFKVGSVGKQLAWQHKRFASVEQYACAMQVWNAAGLAFFVLYCLIGIYLIIIGVISAMAGTGGKW